MMLNCRIFDLNFTYTSYSIPYINFYKEDSNFTSFPAVKDPLSIEGEKALMHN